METQSHESATARDLLSKSFVRQDRQVTESEKDHRFRWSAFIGVEKP
jgi:hypothetical protein